MPITTGRTICRRAFTDMGIFAPGQSIDDADFRDAFDSLNEMVSEWATQPLTIPAITFPDLALVSDKGGPDDPYLIGTGASAGNWNIPKPPNQNSIVGAALLQGNTDPVVEIPLSIMTDAAWASNQIKGQTSSQPTSLWYNPTYADGFGRVYLWPVPDNDTNEIRLYIMQALTEFSSQTAEYIVPDGYVSALRYNLCERLASPYKQPVPRVVEKLATKTLANIKRANTKIVDMAQDTATTSGGHGLYNIITGTGGLN